MTNKSDTYWKKPDFSKSGQIMKDNLIFTKFVFICKECGEVFGNESDRDNCKHMSEKERIEFIERERLT